MNLEASYIYLKCEPQLMKEEYILSYPLEVTNEPYEIAKIEAIKMCRYFNDQDGTNFILVIINNLYGVNDNFDFKKSPKLIRCSFFTTFNLFLLTENKPA